MKKTFLFFIFISIVITSCQERNQVENQIQSFINPPIDHIFIPFTEYILNAEKGDTAFFNSGSFVIFPPNSFVDENGKIIKGNVKVFYREFVNPIDFFLSGIPMNYDSSGVVYNFESMGMIEISATHNGRPLQINQESQPIVNLASKINNGADNCYYLDTINKKWVYRNRTEITDILKDSEERDFTFAYNEQEIVKPRKKSDRPSFSIIIEPGSFPELSEYDSLSFEITENEKKYKPEYGDILWENVKIEKGQRKGTYDVTFEKGKMKVTFETWPILSEAEYDKAIANYKIKKKVSDSKRDSINKEIEKMRVKFELERKRIEEYNAIIKVHNDSILKIIALAKAKQDSLNLIRKREAEKETFVYSKFKIDKFGIWNCDVPILQQGKRLLVNFYSEGANKINLDKFTVIYYDLNAIIKEFNKLTYLQNKKMKIIAIKDNYLYYSSYDDFYNYSIDTIKNKIDIKLRKEIIPKNYNDLCNKLEN